MNATTRALLAGLLTVLWPVAAAADSIGWVQPGGPGSAFVVTYSYANLFDGGFNTSLNVRELRSATEHAMEVWARYAPVHFVEVPDAGPLPADEEYAATPAKIRLGYLESLAGGEAAHAHFPFERVDQGRSGLAGDVHFSNDVSAFGTRMWGAALDGPFALDFFSAMLHELGHSLGIPHILNAPAIMGLIFAVFPQPETADLLPADIAAIRALYGAGVGSVTPLDAGGVVPEPASLVLLATGLVGAWYEQRRRSKR